ncbi:hypothetical protein SteCoe_17206 [Stentor coeruleus]|uniref:Trafficking protein particle complex subunit n=1 Tax=Stentor coeruleus TaxID=5963 RepID=A0A1R2BZS9_9CILI|nr:hypothetical protein SteCoe_17206 [Stentor coeruleus]
MEGLLVFVAVISKDNKPIILQEFRSNTDITMHFVVYSSLDIIERKIVEIRDSNEMTKNYLGYLGPALLGEGDYALYGWLSFTGVKFVAVLKENYEQRNDEKIKSLMQKLEQLYIKTISNPFHDPSDFTSVKFIDKLQKKAKRILKA